MAYKPKPIKTTVEGAINDAFAVFEELAEEMRETADNMESANMGHMPKCEVATEAADELEQHDEPPEVPDHVKDLAVECVEMVNKDKRKGPSRDVRFSNAQTLLQAAVEAIDAYRTAAAETKAAGALDGKQAEADEREQKAEDLNEELMEHTEFSVEFPGMFG